MTLKMGNLPVCADSKYFIYFTSLVFQFVPFIFLHLLDNQQTLHKINASVNHQFVPVPVIKS